MTTPGVPPSSPADDVFRRWISARTRAQRQQAGRLVSDAEREGVCDLLNGAFGEGRLTSAELDVRTSHALAARTHGDLENVLTGLAAPGSPMRWDPRRESGVVPRLLFWVIGLCTSPFVLVGAMFLLFGSDLGDHVFGLVLLVIFLPGLIALYRWAHPRG